MLKLRETNLKEKFNWKNKQDWKNEQICKSKQIEIIRWLMQEKRT